MMGMAGQGRARQREGQDTARQRRVKVKAGQFCDLLARH